MDLFYRVRRSFRVIASNVGPPSSTGEERCRILNASSSSSSKASSCSERRHSAPLEESAKYSEQKESQFAFTNVSFDSTESYSNLNGQHSADNGKIINSHQFRHQDGQEINIRRPPVDLSTAERQFGLIPAEDPTEKMKKRLRSKCTCSLSCLVSFLVSVIPIVSWLPKYRLEYLLPDILSGFTISILHIPQGMAYGILASLKAENGLYVSFFPCFVYFILGTSRHISIGTFAVVSLLVSSAVDRSHTVISRDNFFNFSNASISSNYTVELIPPTHLEMATTLCILVGFWQLIMGAFRLGSLSVLLSDQLVSGFSTAAAFHVAASQLADLFGLSLKKHGELFKFTRIIVDIFQHIGSTNVVTLGISAAAILLLALVKEQVNVRLKLKMPIPIELVVVVIATLVSYLLDLKDDHNVSVMMDIPIGLPMPAVPHFHLASQLLVKSFVIAVVTFVISLSMAKIFSKKHNYKINANQELIAIGCANLFSSFFSCYPCSASLSRSLVQEKSGGKTQLASIVSCCILLLVLLVLAPLFYSLPRCILSAVILVALKGMFLQVKDFFSAWKVSKLDAFIWLVTFLCTVILDVTYGLLCGVLFAVFTVLYRTVVPSKALLGNIIGTDLYLNVQRYREAKEVEGVKIFRFQMSLYFMNVEYFKHSLHNFVPLPDEDKKNEYLTKNTDHVHHVVIDCSSFSYVDISGMDTLLEVMNEYNEINVVVFLAGCSVSMRDILCRADFFPKMPPRSAVFPTIHDAVQFCKDI